MNETPPELVPPPAAPEDLPRSRFDPSQGPHVVAAVILVVSFLYVFGFPLLFFFQSLGGGAAEPTLSARSLLVSLAMNVVVMGLGAVAILGLLTTDPHALGKRLFISPGPAHGRAVGVGIGVTVATMILYALTLAAIGRFVDIERNDIVLELGEELTWPLIVLIALASSISEELYFRALLLPQVGVVASSLLFGLVHLTYGNWLQVIVPAVLGLVFGWLLLRTRSLAAPVAGHFAWNFLQLAGAMVFADDPDLLSFLP